MKAAALLLAAALAGAVAAAEPAPPKVLRYAFEVAETSLDPVKAYDLYAKAAAAFNKTEEPGTAAAAGVKALGEDKAVKSELAARKAFAKVNVAMSKSTVQQKGEVAKFCHDVVKKYPGTPTAEKAKSLAGELGQPVPQ